MNKVALAMCSVTFGVALIASFFASDGPERPQLQTIERQNGDLPAIETGRISCRGLPPYLAVAAPRERRRLFDRSAGDRTKPEIDAARDVSPAQLALQFALEDEDPAWSRPAETRIFSQLSQSTGLAVTSMEVACRATICRIHLIYPSGRRAYPAQLSTLLQTAGFEPRVSFTAGAVDRAPSTTAYLRRGD